MVVSLQSPEVEKTAVEAKANVDSVFVVKGLHGLLSHAGENGEVGWSQDPKLFDSVGDWERFCEVAAASDLITLIYMQLDDHVGELWGRAESFRDLP